MHPDPRVDEVEGPGEPFVHRRQILWGDTDTAGIVYTARVPHFGVEAIEAWFLDRLGVGWYEMVKRLGFGTPFVHLDVDFRSPMTPEHALATRVLLARLGASSLTFDLLGRDGDRVCWTGRFACAVVGPDFRPMPVPERFAEALAREAEIARVVSAAR